MLDAYIIEDIKRQEEARRQAEDERRPRLRIDIGEPLQRPEIADGTELDEEPEEEESPVRIDIGAPTISIRP